MGDIISLAVFTILGIALGMMAFSILDYFFGTKIVVSGYVTDTAINEALPGSSASTRYLVNCTLTDGRTIELMVDEPTYKIIHDGDIIQVRVTIGGLTKDHKNCKIWQQ